MERWGSESCGRGIASRKESRLPEVFGLSAAYSLEKKESSRIFLGFRVRGPDKDLILGRDWVLSLGVSLDTSYRPILLARR